MTRPADILLDSNIIIYALEPAFPAIQAWVATIAPAASAISRIEVLGFHGLTRVKEVHIDQFFAAAAILPIDDLIIDRAILLRRVRRQHHRRNSTGIWSASGNPEHRRL